MTPHSTKVGAATAQKPPLNAQERPPSINQPPNVFLFPPPIVLPIRAALLDTREDSNTSHSSREVDERLTGSIDELGQSLSDPPLQKQHRIQEGEMQTTYVTHTDAGAVRVVELPPPYDELQLQSTHQA